VVKEAIRMDSDFPLQNMFDVTYLDGLDDASLKALYRHAWERSNDPSAAMYWFFQNVLYALEHYPRFNPKPFEKNAEVVRSDV
jgi:hypothetical protein